MDRTSLPKPPKASPDHFPSTSHKPSQSLPKPPQASLKHSQAFPKRPKPPRSIPTSRAATWSVCMCVCYISLLGPPAKRMTGLFFPRSASLGLSGPRQPAKRRTSSQVVQTYIIPPASQPDPYIVEHMYIILFVGRLPGRNCLWVHRLPGRDSACGELPWS